MPEETDELDPQRPHAPGDDEVVDEPEAADPLRQDLGPSFADATGTVRVWVDEHARLKRVRLALRWKERAARGQVLSRMFDQALRVAQARIPAGSPLPAVPIPQVTVHERASWAAAERLRETLFSLDGEVERMAPVVVRGPGGVGHSPDGRVTVRLSELGDTAAVTFDDEWLAEARSSQVAAAVLAAHEDAYRHFVPPTLEADDYLRLMGEAQRVKAEIAALLRNH